jgi:hypothetical protein
VTGHGNLRRGRASGKACRRLPLRQMQACRETYGRTEAMSAYDRCSWSCARSTSPWSPADQHLRRQRAAEGWQSLVGSTRPLRRRPMAPSPYAAPGAERRSAGAAGRCVLAAARAAAARSCNSSARRPPGRVRMPASIRPGRRGVVDPLGQRARQRPGGGQGLDGADHPDEGRRSRRPRRRLPTSSCSPRCSRPWSTRCCGRWSGAARPPGCQPTRRCCCCWTRRRTSRRCAGWTWWPRPAPTRG